MSALKHPTFEHLFGEVGKFQRGTCPGPLAGRILHLKKELEELATAPNDLSEKADVLILALAVIVTAGTTPASPHEVLAAAAAKMEINKLRKWRLLEDGTWTHHPEGNGNPMSSIAKPTPTKPPPPKPKTMR
jgi:hypothetical protein